ncbi:MAG TPA: hypothetical protein VF773_09755 [Verrucomicrobiae bacterium]
MGCCLSVTEPSGEANSQKSALSGRHHCLACKPGPDRREFPPLNLILQFFSRDRCLRFSLVLFLTGSLFYYLCQTQHFCIGGHLLHPDDYTPLAPVTDVYWLIAFVGSILLIFRSELTFRYSFIFAFGVAFLLFSWRTELYNILGLAIHMGLAVFAIACWRSWIE